MSLKTHPSEKPKSVKFEQRGYNKLKQSYRRQDYYRTRGDNKQQRFRSQSSSPVRKPRDAWRYLSRHKEKCLNCRPCGQFYKGCPEKDISAGIVQHTEQNIFKHKKMSLCMKETEKKKVMTALCHNVETYNSIQPNKEDDECYQQLKPRKGWTDTKSFPLDIKSHYVNVSWKKGLKTNQAECVYT